jgi:hypothetical protein
MQRHALAFRVRPSSQDEVAALLSGYDPPALRVDAHTRLLATAVFMLGNQVVRCMEIEGDLRAAAAHVAADPRVRAVEGQLHAHLEEPYDLDDPAGRQSFFRTRLMTRLAHVGPDAQVPAPTGRRLAVRLAVTPGTARSQGEALAREGLLHGPVGAAQVLDASLFVQGDDTLVQILTVDGDVADVLAALEGSHPELFRTILERDSRTTPGPDRRLPSPDDAFEEASS